MAKKPTPTPQPPQAPQTPPTAKQKGEYYFWGETSEKNIENAITWILDMNALEKDKPKALTLYINSYGGCLASGQSLVYVMRHSAIPVNTVGTGMVVSCGLMIFMAGRHRKISSMADILTHQYYASIPWQKHHEHQAEFKRNEMTLDRMVQHYIACTGLTDKVIRSELLGPTDFWMTPEQAIDYNMADEIIDTFNR